MRWWWSTRAWALALVVLELLPAARADADAGGSQTVLWLEAGDGEPAAERERALRLELEARGMVLLQTSRTVPDSEVPKGPWSREALARRRLVLTPADAALWLEGDPNRRVSWLRVVERRGRLARAPLPQPPDAINPKLFAIAAANLLQEVLYAPPLQPARVPHRAALHHRGKIATSGL